MARFGATSWLANALARLVAQSRHPGPGPRSFEGGASATRIKSSTSSHPRRKLSRKGRSGRNAASESSRSTERWFVSQVGIEMSELDASPFSKGGAEGRRHENQKEDVMKTITFMFGASALLISLGTAAAGPCSTEIESLTKFMAARDAGAGPTAGAASTTSGQHPPTAAMGAADPSTAASSTAAQSARPQHPPTAAMNEATQGGGASAQPGNTAPAQHPPTAAMSQATQGGAASPQDVQSQTRGGPTAVQQAEGARRPASDQLASPEAALEQARSYDGAGQEAQCMDAIARAKQLAR